MMGTHLKLLIILMSGLLVSSTYNAVKYNYTVPIKILPSYFELVNMLEAQIQKTVSTKLVRFPWVLLPLK